MRKFLRKAYHKTFGVARSFADFHILDCLPGVESWSDSRSSLDSSRDDAYLLNRGNEAAGNQIFGSTKSSEDVDMPLQEDSSEEEAPLRDEPSFTEGPARFIVAKDNDAKDCLALLITGRLIEVFNDNAEDERKREATESAIHKLKIRESKLQYLIESSNDNAGDVVGQKGGAEKLDNTVRLQSRLDKLRDKKRFLQEDLKIFGDNIAFGHTEAQHMFEKAMDQANLLRKPKCEPIGPALDDEEEDEGEENHNDVETVKSTSSTEIPNEQTAARKEFEEAQRALLQAQFEFDQKEYRNQIDLADFEMAAESGETDWTRSQFDRRAILVSQDLTGALIDAENAYEYAREQAEKLGVFDDGWGQSSYYGHSQCTEQSLGDGQAIEGDFSSALSAATKDFITAWSANLDDHGHIEEFTPIEVDEWDSRTVDLSDSISAIEYGPIKRRINDWQRWCGEHRQGWQPQEPETEDLWVVGGYVLSRRRSWSL